MTTADDDDDAELAERARRFVEEAAARRLRFRWVEGFRSQRAADASVYFDAGVSWAAKLTGFDPTYRLSREWLGFSYPLEQRRHRRHDIRPVDFASLRPGDLVQMRGHRLGARGGNGRYETQLVDLYFEVESLTNLALRALELSEHEVVAKLTDRARAARDTDG